MTLSKKNWNQILEMKKVFLGSQADPKQPMKQDQSTVIVLNVVNRRCGQCKSVAATFPLVMCVAGDILSGILEGTRQSLNEAFPARLEPPGSIIYLLYRAFSSMDGRTAGQKAYKSWPA